MTRSTVRHGERGAVDARCTSASPRRARNFRDGPKARRQSAWRVAPQSPAEITKVPDGTDSVPSLLTNGRVVTPCSGNVSLAPPQSVKSSAGPFGFSWGFPAGDFASFPRWILSEGVEMTEVAESGGKPSSLPVPLSSGHKSNSQNTGNSTQSKHILRSRWIPKVFKNDSMVGH